MNQDHAPDAPDIVGQIKEIVAQSTEEAIAPLRALLERKSEPEPPKGEDVGGAPQPDTSHLRDQRAAYERSGLNELMDFDEFIKGIEV
jgi:hypothetical protein